MLTPQSDAKATSVWPAHYVFVFANAVGCGVYLVKASYGWRIPEEHGMIPITGEPFAWFVGIAPVLIVLFVINAFWIAQIMNRKQRRSRALFLLVAALWIVTIVVDFAHH